ncbi:hypothetical protein KBB76_02560 [Candidatus Saccharibacteria bacterium]|jgi:hypothetical protein|nr:hypothetical protein [Candidatus Saccharibacteria bacterium]
MIDVSFDFQKEANYKDPDRYSPTLQEYHRILWSKPLPNGKPFTLTKISNNRLYHKSSLGEFYLSSDRAITSFWKRKSFNHIASEFSVDELKEYDRILDTIGGIVVWPSNRIEGCQTINGARGFNRMISDRLDLTIECIRLFYAGEKSPLYNTLKLYEDFFSLFGDFQGFITFFLLQDALTNDFTKVKIAEPFDNFNSSPVPRNITEFLQYRDKTIEFVNLRNKRIKNYTKTL